MSEPKRRATLSEIDATCAKAMRGAGCFAGYAEEGGKAARWLAAFGLAGPEALARLLSNPRNCRCAGAQALGGDRARAPRCPIALGAEISDRADLSAQASVRLKRVAEPLLLTPFAAWAAAAGGGRLALAFEGFEAVVGGTGATLRMAAPAPPATADVDLRPVEAAALEAIAPSPASRLVDADAWATLERFAEKTYVPASDASRLAGAGAGLSDND